MVQMAKKMERERNRQFREQERQRKAIARNRALEAKQQMSELAQQMTRELEQSIEDLTNILGCALAVSTAIDFDSMKISPDIPPLDLGSFRGEILPPKWSEFEPKTPHPLIGWISFVRSAYSMRLMEAHRSFKQAEVRNQKLESDRQIAVRRLVDERNRKVKAAREEAMQHNTAIDAWRKDFNNKEQLAIEEYFHLVLTNSIYPTGFPQEMKIAYIETSNQLVLEYSFPTLDAVIPKHKKFTHVKSSNSISESLRPEKERRALYTSVIAQCALRCLHEIFEADTIGCCETVVFNGYVDAIDPGTGQNKRPCLVTIRVSNTQFSGINLRMADPVAALQALNASFSKSPAELVPVRPLLELNMVDRRFIKETDVLSALDQRPNLMDLSAGEFESLITNLFQRMGLETKLTQASRDGGVDCVAFDSRPIFGGKVVIQAKRYKNTVGVSAVRDLYGTMMNEGASKGILVTTSGYGKASFDFANGKPIELLDGGNLLYLLLEHAGVDARIVMPDDWQDAQIVS